MSLSMGKHLGLIGLIIDYITQVGYARQRLRMSSILFESLEYLSPHINFSSLPSSPNITGVLGRKFSYRYDGDNEWGGYIIDNGLWLK